MAGTVAQLAGPLLLGYSLNWFLHGVLTVQVYVYWTAFSKDTRLLQTLIYGIYLLETVQTTLLTHDAFQAFVFGFMDPASMDDLHTLWLDAYFFDGLVALLVQLCYANRIRALLSRFEVIPGIIALLTITQFACAIGASINFRNIQFSNVYEEMSASPMKFTIGCLWVGCSLAADIIIAVTMVYALSRYDTTAKETRNLVSRLNRLAMETGSLVGLAHTYVSVLALQFVPGLELLYNSGSGHCKTLFELVISIF
uniref:DUF6534 domain-containing protein n=1 Tax=Moniliophthora roreri TaxID=221103 RepID=A0A0W0G8W8_MONRR